MAAETLPPFVSLDWAMANRDRVRLVDCRWSLDGAVGRADWLAGHLPGAVFADLDHDLAGPPRPGSGRHPLPDPDDFAFAMQRLGIHDDTPVVAYDTSSGGIAARLVWMLRILGHPAAVLDHRGTELGAAMEDGEVDVAMGSFRPRPWPVGALVAIDEVAAATQDPDGGVVVDARSSDRWRGEAEPVDARAGHIPGTVNVPWTDLLERGRVAEPNAVRSALAAVGIDGDGDVIVHCGSGVTACHQALAMEHVGLPRPRVFVGSFSAWADDPDRPVATGTD